VEPASHCECDDPLNYGIIKGLQDVPADSKGVEFSLEVLCLLASPENLLCSNFF